MANNSKQTIMQGQSPLDLAVQNIVTANREHRPGVEVAAGLLYATILENTNIPSKDLPRYIQLTHIANAAGFIENAIPTVTGLVNSVVNIPEKVSATVSAFPQALQNGADNLKSGKFVADIVVGIANHINRANHPIQTTLAAAEYAYHAVKNDGGNMNMEERKALAVLYRQPQTARLEALRTGEWDKFIQMATITVGPKIAMDAPAVMQRANNFLTPSVTVLASLPEMAAAEVGAINMGADPVEEASATVMRSTGSSKGGALEVMTNVAATSKAQQLFFILDDLRSEVYAVGSKGTKTLANNGTFSFSVAENAHLDNQVILHASQLLSYALIQAEHDLIGTLPYGKEIQATQLKREKTLNEINLLEKKLGRDEFESGAMDRIIYLQQIKDSPELTQLNTELEKIYQESDKLQVQAYDLIQDTFSYKPQNLIITPKHIEEIMDKTIEAANLEVALFKETNPNALDEALKLEGKNLESLNWLKQHLEETQKMQQTPSFYGKIVPQNDQQR